MLPPQNLARELVEYAQNNFLDKADGYCLSDNVHPHITLCQFQSEEMPLINVLDKLIKSVYILEPETRKGTDIHADFYWLSLIVEKEDWLKNLQAEIHSQLSEKNYLVRTQTGDLYSPHITFCRTSEKVEFDNDVIGFIKETNGWTFQVGRSDVNGQYLGKI